MSCRELDAWVDSVAAATRPDTVHWCDGSDMEIERLYDGMAASGALLRLDEGKHPGSYYARSDVNDVARAEERTFICSAKQDDAGPTNNWKNPAAMHALLDPLFAGCMRGRTMYVVPYLMGPPASALARVGVEITDSPYVVANMRIMTRMGRVALEHLNDGGEFVKGMHSTGALDPTQRYISHFPDENLITTTQNSCKS